jgi:hypothetical protein
MPRNELADFHFTNRKMGKDNTKELKAYERYSASFIIK